MDDAATSRLADWLRRPLGAHAVTLSGWRKLTGGAIQQNWAVDADIAGGSHAGHHAWVLRTDSAATLAVSRPRREEFQLLTAAHAAGVAVPRPWLLCEDGDVLGRPFFVMSRIAGVTRGHLVVRDAALGGGRSALAAALGDQLARIHAIPATGLACLGTPPTDPATQAIARWRAALDAHDTPRPILEWGLRHLELRPPAATPPVLCHNDFRTGNIMLDHAGITGILDWEFAAWGDPHEDIGWLTAPCWRFGNAGMPVGGIGPMAPFAAAYAARSGLRIDPVAVAWWQLLGTIRWAIIAIDQAARHVSGAEPSLELALTGHLVPELELDVLRMTEALADA
jgi:aminoglycoside phosphotransferase (APT) family kinase protein